MDATSRWESDHEHEVVVIFLLERDFEQVGCTDIFVDLLPE